MEFKYYDPEKVASAIIKKGIRSYYNLCWGCVFTDVPPEDCFHSNLRSTSVQAEKMCHHCAETVEGDKKPFHFHVDDEFEEKVRELEKIFEIAIKQ